MHWLCETDILKQIQVYSEKANSNNTGSFTKHFPPIIHHQKQSRYVHSAHIVESCNRHSIHNTVKLSEGVFNQVLSS